MKPNYTHVSVLLDRSGSMRSIMDDTIGGYNTFLKTQKELPGEMTLSLSQFDDLYEVVNDFTPIKEVKKLTEKTFVPRGTTALLDSLAKLIIQTGKKLADLSEDARPEKVLVLVLTDGQENASVEYKGDTLKEMIDHQKNVYNWEFMYIGANQDAFTVGASLNMSGVNYTATTAGTRGVYAATTDALKKYRSAPAGASFSLKQEDIDNASK